MYEFIFKQSTDLQQRLTGDTVEDPTIAEAYAPDDSETTATLAAMQTPSGKGGGSFWNRLFEMLFGWLKPDREPETEVSAPAPEPEPEPEPEPVAEEPAPIEEETPQDTGSDPETPPVTNETDPVEDDPEPVTEDPVPTPDPEPVAEEPTPTPDSEPVAEDPAPGPVVTDPTEPVTDAPEPVSVARQVAPTALDTSAAISVAGGRVTTFALPDAANITGITIDSLPAHGNVTVNPDFTLALVLSGSDYNGPLSFDYTVTHSDGTVDTRTATLDVAEPTQAAGWGLGNHYMLETDANENIVVEHGDNHRKVYISGSEDALTRADIAALEDVSESVITTAWLRNNPEYGGSEGMALAADVGMEVWYSLIGPSNGPVSHWLLFERGYTYEDTGRLIGWGSNGESDLAPIHITSWGAGSRPVLVDEIKQYQMPSSNYVIQNIEFPAGALALGLTDAIFDGVKFGSEVSIQNLDGSGRVTFRSSEFVDAYKTAPLNATWEGHGDRESGIFASKIEGFLIEDSLFLHNGWAEGYDGSVDQGHPPSQYSHNAYINPSMTDVTFRDNITAQGASMGASLAGGAFAENNIFLDNNLGVSINATGVDTGNFTLFLDNLITSSGYKKSASPGALDWGISDNGNQSSYYGNIIAHNANPDDAIEIAKKGDASSAFRDSANLFFNDTIIHNWKAAQQSIGDLDPAALNQITIQNFAMVFLGLDPSTAPANEDMGLYYKSGLIYALMDYARENWGDGSLTAQDIIDYFQAGFGIDLTPTGDTHHRFIPNDLGDGVRWDNRLNWTSDALPEDGDTVDLGGNWVNFSDTVTVASLDLGTGGKLQVGSGKLTIDALETGANGMIFVERAGQVWADGYAGDTLLSLHMTGGRFANTGDVSGPVVASVTDGQMILAADDAQFLLAENSELRIEGTGAKVGFDGATGGVATLMMQDGGQLSFVASADGLGRITEFRSGAWDQDGSNVQSGIALDGTLTLDLSDYIGTGQMKLVEVDAIVGMFDDIQIHGLGDNRDADIVIDYAADLITLELSAGTGQGRLETRGDATYGDDEDANLWDELTAGLEQGDDPDAPVTVFDDPIDTLPEMSFI